MRGRERGGTGEEGREEKGSGGQGSGGKGSERMTLRTPCCKFLSMPLRYDNDRLENLYRVSQNYGL